MFIYRGIMVMMWSHRYYMCYYSLFTMFPHEWTMNIATAYFYLWIVCELILKYQPIWRRRYHCKMWNLSWIVPFSWCCAINTLRPSDAYIFVGNLATIGSDNGLSPGRHQAITWTNAGILLIGPSWTNLRNKLQWNFNRNSNIFIQADALQNVVCEMGSILSRPQCVKVRAAIDAAVNGKFGVS